jgi:hypothetical protein
MALISTQTARNAAAGADSAWQCFEIPLLIPGKRLSALDVAIVHISILSAKQLDGRLNNRSTQLTI